MTLKELYALLSTVEKGSEMEAAIKAEIDAIRSTGKKPDELARLTKQVATLTKSLADMTVEELIICAAKNGIDLGQATTAAGMIKKIQAAEKRDAE